MAYEMWISCMQLTPLVAPENFCRINPVQQGLMLEFHAVFVTCDCHVEN